jgi:hypothetical protein
VNLDWKLASAFGTGAVLASGIVYLAVRPVDVVRPVNVVQRAEPPREAVKPAVAAKAVALAPVAVEPRRVAALPAPTHDAPIHRTPVREKPSPMPPPVRRLREVAIARNEQPTLPPPVEPAVHPIQPTPPPVAVTPPPAPVTVAPPPAPVTAGPPPRAESVPVQNVSLPASEVRVPHTVTLAAGTLLPVRIGETLSSAHSQIGDTFLATLTQPLVIDGFVIAERGARVEGRVVDAAQAGRVRGLSHLGISVVRLATSDGQNIRIRTEPYVKDGGSSTGTDAAKIGGGAALGAIIGAIAGGGKGAAIGAGAGGAVGAGDVMLTHGPSAEIKVETRVTFRVQDSVTITERLD